MFWHCWAITTWILGRAASSSSAHLLGKQDQTSELGLGVCRELLCPRGSMLGAQCRCPGMVLAAPQSRRGASPEECLSLGFWDASSKDSEPESCTWEQQECCFQETGGLPGQTQAPLQGAGLKMCGHLGWSHLWGGFSLTPVWFLGLQRRCCCCSAPCSDYLPDAIPFPWTVKISVPVIFGAEV